MRYGSGIQSLRNEGGCAVRSLHPITTHTPEMSPVRASNIENKRNRGKLLGWLSIARKQVRKWSMIKPGLEAMVVLSCKSHPCGARRHNKSQLRSHFLFLHSPSQSLPKNFNRNPVTSKNAMAFKKREPEGVVKRHDRYTVPVIVRSSDMSDQQKAGKLAPRHTCQGSKSRPNPNTINRPVELNSKRPSVACRRSSSAEQQMVVPQTLAKASVELQRVCLFPMDGFAIPQWGDSEFRAPMKLDVGIWQAPTRSMNRLL